MCALAVRNNEIQLMFPSVQLTLKSREMFIFSPCDQLRRKAFEHLR